MNWQTGYNISLFLVIDARRGTEQPCGSWIYKKQNKGKRERERFFTDELEGHMFLNVWRWKGNGLREKLSKRG